MRRRQTRRTFAVVLGGALAASSLTACDVSLHRDRPSDSATAAQPRAVASHVDVMRMLDLVGSINPTYVAAHGTCIPIDGEGRSRLIYLMLPAESSYVRLDVVAPSRGPIELIDLVRGVPDGRIWAATLDHPRQPAKARLFASANDKTPETEEWPDQDPRSQRLREVAAIAIEAPCLQR